MRLRYRTSRALFKKALTSWYFIKTFQYPEINRGCFAFIIYKLNQPAPIFLKCEATLRSMKSCIAKAILGNSMARRGMPYTSFWVYWCVPAINGVSEVHDSGWVLDKVSNQFHIFLTWLQRKQRSPLHWSTVWHPCWEKSQRLISER